MRPGQTFGGHPRFFGGKVDKRRKQHFERVVKIRELILQARQGLCLDPVVGEDELVICLQNDFSSSASSFGFVPIRSVESSSEKSLAEDW